jgi:hypothetical protein
MILGDNVALAMGDADKSCSTTTGGEVECRTAFELPDLREAASGLSCSWMLLPDADRGIAVGAGF